MIYHSRNFVPNFVTQVASVRMTKSIKKAANYLIILPLRELSVLLLGGDENLVPKKFPITSISLEYKTGAKNLMPKISATSKTRTKFLGIRIFAGVIFQRRNIWNIHQKL